MSTELMMSGNLFVQKKQIKCKIITLSSGDNPTEMLKTAMNQLKAGGYRWCQFTTLFQTTNPDEQYRPGRGIDLTAQNPQFCMWINKPTQSDKFYEEIGYHTYVNAPIRGYSVQYY